MANALGIDLGQVYRTTEAVKTSRMDRQDREAARQRAKTVNALRGKAIGDDGQIDRQGMGQLVAFAPDEAKKITDAFSKMNEEERAQAKDRIDKVGQMSAFILQSDNPENAYQVARQSLDPQITANMPEEYDPNFVQMGLARAREIDDMLANPEQVTFGAEDRLYKDGQVVERTMSDKERSRRTSRGNALIRASSGSGSDGRELKSSDTNAIYRQAAGMFGGAIDPTTGRISGLDAGESSKVQSIAERASQLYADEDTRTHSAAVSQASRELGISVQNLGLGNNPPTPEGVQRSGGTDRNELLNQYLQ